jgi:hypothetical protein
MLKKFLLILSHSKSKFREEQKNHLLNTNNDRFIFYYFIGDMNLSENYKVDEENKIVYLKVPDNYESLSLKTYYAMKFISENYLDQISGVFKTDDDIILDIDKLSKCIDENKKHKYFGVGAGSGAYESDYHFGKCESITLNSRKLFIPECKYCAGGGYYISKELINNILDNIKIFEDVIFEDAAVGVSMNKYNIYPFDIDIKSNGCKWDNPEIKNKSIPVNIPTIITTCSCGEKINKVRYNYCTKCNKLY